MKDSSPYDIEKINRDHRRHTSADNELCSEEVHVRGAVAARLEGVYSPRYINFFCQLHYGQNYQHPELDIRELLEQEKMIEALPASTNLCSVAGWRTRLLTKLRMKLTELEEHYQRSVHGDWNRHLEVLKGDGPTTSGVSFTFFDDLRLVDDFFTKAYDVAKKNILCQSRIRYPIPALPRQVDLAILRLVSDIKTLNNFC
ncbi:unnamed protein product [Strongylus vulgaris]|uniref:Uncharacterized protein n=1 Tax=Strongylus vulgaris TaxID=40348 RepID=A0A3P7K386_STRVU|nr:unnamed protein product [Strongylus vulgaris]